MEKINWDFDINLHPVLNWCDIRIETPSIIKLREDVTKYVWTYAPGAAIVGWARDGKSTAMEMLNGSIKDRSGKQVPIIIYSVHKRDKKTVAALYKNICEYLQLPIDKIRDVDGMKAQIITCIAELSIQSNMRQVILVVDEAQRLSIAQVDVFSEIYDYVKKFYHIQLTIFFIGNLEQLSKLLKRIKDGENQHIQARFFKRTTRFRGLTSAADVGYCLKFYDNTRYPFNGPFYTQVFLKKEWDEGFRYHSLSSSFWSVFREYKKKYKLDSWGTENFVGTASILLSDYLPRYGVNEHVEEMIKKSIDTCDLV